ncbi:histidine phosphatase family protein [Nonomuraea sp. NPDC050556]|uniref:histidine phosphatase family protein n=1 Tax=Nonomuraea sp. NPDC050556 TaxID=3364369 RepID=UPI00378EA48D
MVGELAEPDFGRWVGLPYAQIDPDELAAWLADPEVAPHGGESLAAHASRVAGWLTTAPPDALVVCDVWTIRAALGLTPLVAARFDLAPLSTTEVSGGRITHVNRKVTS